MFNFISSIVLASLLIPSGFDFLIGKSIDFPYVREVENKPSAPKRIANNSFGLETSAKSLVVFDDKSETVLYSKNSGAKLPVASITKLMTALVFLDTKPDLDSTIVILRSDLREGGITRLIPGEEVTLRELLGVTLVSSANEGAIALARASGLENFPAAMNKKARELEMWQSYFFDPSGIDPRNSSRPADLLKLAEAAFSHSVITQALTQPLYSFTTANTGRRGAVENTDRLLESFLNNGVDYKIIGAKTGYLDEAGYCLLLKVQKVGGSSLTLVILGADSPNSRWQEAKGLVDWVFDNYQWDQSPIENSEI